MTENLSQRIAQFLENTTSYALLIKGKTGIGKTYYIKNKLFPKVGKAIGSTAFSHEHYYPVYISLFGVTTVEEIKEQLFLECVPLLKDKNVNIDAEFRRFLSRMFCKIDIEKFIHQEKILVAHKKAHIISKILRFLAALFFKPRNTSSAKVKILLCIDDIHKDRTALEYKDFFGFINTILENTNIKVILIETKVPFNNSVFDHYLMRERFIDESIIFTSNMAFAYEEIITSKYKEKSPHYFNFLQEHRQDIISKIEEHESTLRTLIFFLEHYEKIYTTVKEELKKHENPELSKAKYFRLTLNYTLSVSIEFKTGKLTPNIILYLKQYTDGKYFIKSPFEDDLTPKELELYNEISSYVETDIEGDSENIQQRPKMDFKSIFDYITGYNSWIGEDLVHELKPFRVIDKYPTFNKLFEPEGIDLPMLDIEHLIDKMLNLVDNAEFHLSEYAEVFIVVINFFYTPNRVSKMEAENDKINSNQPKEIQKQLVKRFKKAIDKWEQKHNSLGHPEFNVNLGEDTRFDIISKNYPKLNPMLGDFPLKRMHFKNPFKNYGANLGHQNIQDLNLDKSANEIREYTIEVYIKIMKRKEQKKIQTLLELYKKDMMAFIHKISDPNTLLSDYPIYSKLNFEEFWTVLKKAKNSQLMAFGHHIEKRYHSELEKDFFLFLTEKIKEENEKFTNPLYMHFDQITIRTLFDILRKRISNIDHDSTIL